MIAVEPPLPASPELKLLLLPDEGPFPTGPPLAASPVIVPPANFGVGEGVGLSAQTIVTTDKLNNIAAGNFVFILFERNWKTERPCRTSPLIRSVNKFLFATLNESVQYPEV